MIFTFFRKVFKKLVMTFTAKNLVTGGVEKSTPFVVNNENSLSIEEINLILQTIRNSSFKGEHVELVYNTVLKLQKQYINLQQ